MTREQVFDMLFVSALVFIGFMFVMVIVTAAGV